MHGLNIMFLGLILLPIFSALCIFNEDFVYGIAFGMFIITIGAIKFGKDEGLI